MKRFATANWKGTGKEGKGTLTSQSTVLNQTQYSYNTRFEDGIGTNPEELIAAAHAACFTMKLSFVLVAAGFTAENINTRCDISLEAGVITQSQITLKASVPGITAEKFQEAIADVKANCIVSKVLNCEIVCEAQLEAVTA